MSKLSFCLYTSPPPRLVTTSRALAGLQLIQIPSTDGQITAVLVHAGAEIPHVRRTGAGGLEVVVGGEGAVFSLRDGRLGGFGRRGGRGAAAEEAAEGVADGGANCYTAKERLADVRILAPALTDRLRLLLCRTSSSLASEVCDDGTYAAVLAI